MIDRRPDAFRRLGSNFAGTTVTGVGFDRDRLTEAGIERAAAVAAVTSGDNSNILVARVARENFGIEHVVARIYDPQRAMIYQRLGIPTIATVAWTTDQVLRRLVPDDRPPEWTDPTTTIGIVDRAIDEHWAGQPLAELEAAIGARVAGVNRMGSAIVPTERTVVQAGDVAYIAVEVERLGDVDAKLRASVEAGH